MRLLFRFVLLLAAILTAGTAISQLRDTAAFSTEIRFARYLFDKELYTEASYVLDQLHDSALQRPQRDSLYYWQGWIAYSTKRLPYAAERFRLVSDSCDLASKSRFFEAYCLAFMRDTAAAGRVLLSLPATDSLTREMVSFQQAGISLLRRDYAQYNALRQNFSYAYYFMEAEEKRMDDYRDKLGMARKKSAFLAGFYSAVIPGAGKIYAGKKKQGIGSFLPVISLAALTYEAYNRGGVKSARFIGFGSLFCLFYTANIWGSVMSVKVTQHERNTYYDNKILFDMHIPLRNLYR
ncbi:hypothetical protein [Filimonas effusa]|uniref:Tetratricopeptide repeat protein n=1 Tax=Filimonas effusa TaxID=2508721 RepID=A0A4Q1D304_9BACT|nr:hypothetical protein [Filimonas effusa]RXK81471.1 hypothetical protein ESB13_21315 [Filimonas effusa]